MDPVYSSESPTRPARRPNACAQCGAFRLIREQYQAPTTHFGSCAHFIDQGVIRMNGPGERQRGRH